MTDPIICPECGRRYTYDYCTAELRETLRSQAVKRPSCAHCQRPAAAELDSRAAT